MKIPHGLRSFRFALASVPALLASSFVSAQTINWTPSGLVGAGTQNCVAIQPGGTGVVVSASDVSGLQRSTDSGVTWHGSNLGTPVSGPSKVACVVFTNDTSNPNTVYAGSGNAGSGGGFLASTDGGQTWTMRSTTPQFSGNGETVAGLPSRWPRSTGNLIIPDESGTTKYIYAGTFSQGVMRSAGGSGGGTTWTNIGLSGGTHYLRSLALNPTNSSNLIASAYGEKLWRTTNAHSSPATWTQSTTGPDECEELLILTDGTAYAAGTDTATGGGVWKSTNSGSSWTKLSGPATTASWLAIAGYGTGATAVLYIGATDGAVQTDGSYASIMKSTNGGSTWADVTSSTNGNVVDQIGGAGGPGWWMWATGNYYMLGESTGDMANIQIDPSNHDRVLIAGRGGLWGTTNGTAANASIRWYPMIAGLSVSVNECVVTDPNHPGRAYCGDEDWVLFYTKDSGQTFAQNPPVGKGKTSRSIWVDPISSVVYCGTLDDSAITGSVFSNPDPTVATNSWTDTGLAAATGNAGAGYRVRGVASGRDASGNIVLLADVDESQGIWRKDGSGAWTNPSTAILPQGADTVPFAWNKNSKYVFVYTGDTGLWRSADYGSTWTKIWATGSTATGTGWVVQDPANDGTLYVSTDTGVFRFTGATTGTGLTPTNIGGPANPGAIALAGGVLYACDIVSGTHVARMYRWTSPATSSTSTVISDSVVYPGQSNWPSGLAVDGNNTIYVSERDEGEMLGTPPAGPLFSDNFTAGAGNWTAGTGTWSIVTKSGNQLYEQSSAPTQGVTTVNVAGSSSWQNYSVSADITPLTFTTGSLGISLYYADSNDRYVAQITPAGTANIKKVAAGTQTTLGTGTFTTGSTYTVKFSASNSGGTATLTMSVNGAVVATATDSSSPFTTGTVALDTYMGSSDFDNVVVTQP